MGSLIVSAELAYRSFFRPSVAAPTQEAAATNRNGNYKLLGAEITYEQGCFSRQVHYYEGHQRALLKNPWSDRLIDGLSGPETKVVLDVIRPICTFEVKPTAWMQLKKYIGDFLNDENSFSYGLAPGK